RGGAGDDHGAGRDDLALSLLLGLLAFLSMLDDVPLLEQHRTQDRPPRGLASGKELERHREVLELLLLRVLHDRLRRRVALHRLPLLIPPDRLAPRLPRPG